MKDQYYLSILKQPYKRIPIIRLVIMINNVSGVLYENNVSKMFQTRFSTNNAFKSEQEISRNG